MGGDKNTATQRKVKHVVNKIFIQCVRAVNSFFPEKQDHTTGEYSYGNNNKLPNMLMKWVLDSGTAKLAPEKRTEYIAAYGFIDKAANDIRVNEHQTAKDIITEIAGYLSYFKGFSLRVQRDGNLNPAKIKVLPFQDVRVLGGNKYRYNPSFSQAMFDKSKDQYIHGYIREKPDNIRLQKIMDNGELLYVFNKTADNPHYPVPVYYAGIEDVKTSSELQKFDFETVLNGFLTSAILTILGSVDDVNKDERGKTERDYLEEELKQFTGMGKSADGQSGRMRLLVMNARNKEEAPILQAFDSKIILDASNNKRDIIDRAVSRLFKVHPCLIGFADPQILGNKQAMANASEELNKSVIEDQVLIERAFQELFPEKGNIFKMSTFRPITYIPDAILQDLTPDERRQLVSYPVLEQQNTGEKLLSERLGVGGTGSLVQIVESQVLSREQKLNIIQILFSISAEDANKIVGPEKTNNA